MFQTSSTFANCTHVLKEQKESRVLFIEQKIQQHNNYINYAFLLRSKLFLENIWGHTVLNLEKKEMDSRLVI